MEEYCQIYEGTGTCEIRSGKVLGDNYICKMDYNQTECKRQLKECYRLNTDNCNLGEDTWKS